MVTFQSASFLFFLFFSLLALAMPEYADQHIGVLTQNVRGEAIEFLVGDSAETTQQSPSTQKIINAALSLSGTPYRSGGTDPQTGFDCSGFVRYVFNQAANITLPASAKNIAHIGKVVDKKALNPGDLVFFNTLQSTYSHVAIYLGDQSFIHAPSKGGVVRIDRMDTQYWTKHFEGARRITVD